MLDVVLSERKPLSLLSKLYTPGSACLLLVGDVPDGFAEVRLRAEPDEYQYYSPTREGTRAGVMHPLTERVLVAVRAAIAEYIADSATDIEGWRR